MHIFKKIKNISRHLKLEMAIPGSNERKGETNHSAGQRLINAVNLGPKPGSFPRLCQRT